MRHVAQRETDCISNVTQCETECGMESQSVLLSVEDIMLVMVGWKPRCETESVCKGGMEAKVYCLVWKILCF